MRGVLPRLFAFVLLLPLITVNAQQDLPPLPFAALNERGELYLYGFSTFPQPVPVSNGGQGVLDPGYFIREWSVDGRALLIVRTIDNGVDRRLTVYDRQTGTVTDYPIEQDDLPVMATFGLDSRSLYFAQRQDSEIFVNRIALTLNAPVETVATLTGESCGGGGGAGGLAPEVARYDNAERDNSGTGSALLRDTPYGLFFRLPCIGAQTGLIDLTTGEVQALPELASSVVAMNVNRTQVVGRQQDNRLTRVNLVSGTVTEASLDDTIGFVEIGRDGSVYYTTRTPLADDSLVNQSSIKRVDFANNTATEIYRVDAHGITDLQLSPNDRELIFNVIPNVANLDVSNADEDERLERSQPELTRVDVETGEGTFVTSGASYVRLNPVAYSVPFAGAVSYDIPGSTPTTSNITPTQPDTTAPNRVRLSPDVAGGLGLYAILQRPGVREVAWSPGGSVLAIAGSNVVYLYQMSDLSLAPLELPQRGAVLDMSFNPDGSLLATTTGTLVSTWRVDDGFQRDVFGVNALDIDYSPDGSLIAYYSQNGDLALYDVLRQNDIVLDHGSGAVRHSGLAFNRTGDVLAVGLQSGDVQLWDVRSGQLQSMLADPDGIQRPVQGELTQDPRDILAYGDSGRTLATADLTIPRSLRLWSPNSGALLGRVRVPAENAYSSATFFAMAMDERAGLLAAVAGDYAMDAIPADRDVIVWDIATQTQLAALPHTGATGIAISPDNTLIASVGGGQVRLWTPRNGIPTQAQLQNYSLENVLAACETFGIVPNRVEPTETVSLVWSWYAASDALVFDHLATAQYRVTMDGVPIDSWLYTSQVLPDAINADNPTIYFYAPIGTLPSGQRTVMIDVTWTQPISDGFSQFGPGTANPQDSGRCQFLVG